MRRREFITLIGGAAVAWPLTARAQQPDRMRRIGVLMAYAEDDPEGIVRAREISAGARKAWMVGGPQCPHRLSLYGRQGRSVSGARERAGRTATRRDPRTCDCRNAAALQQETRAIPIVFVNVSDPIGSGFITSLARPGGNLTGVLHYEASIAGKWLAMLKEIAPQPCARRSRRQPQDDRPATITSCGRPRPRLRRSRSSSYPVTSRTPPTSSAPSSHSRACRTAVWSCCRTITTNVHRDLIIALAARHRLPAIYSARLFVAAGGLMSYGTDQVEMFRQTATYVDRILRGAKPADLPVQAPTRYETVLNLKTAKALGLDVPPSLLVRRRRGDRINDSMSAIGT